MLNIQTVHDLPFNHVQDQSFCSRYRFLNPGRGSNVQAIGNKDSWIHCWKENILFCVTTFYGIKDKSGPITLSNLDPLPSVICRGSQGLAPGGLQSHKKKGGQFHPTLHTLACWVLLFAIMEEIHQFPLWSPLRSCRHQEHQTERPPDCWLPLIFVYPLWNSK